MPEKSFKNNPNYKWVVVALCFLMIFVCLGFCSSNKSLYLQPITDYLGISRTAFSVGDSIRFITTAIVNIFFGTLVKKFGTKKLIVAGILSLSVSTCIYSFADKIYWFYVAGAFLGLGFSWTTTTMVGCVVGRWYSEKKGTIMGAVLASNGISAAHMKDVGIAPSFIAIKVSIHSLMLSASKFISGIMYDKFGLKVTAFYCDVTAVVTMFVLASVSSSSVGMTLAMVYGIVSSMALPLETIMLPIFAGDLFGTRSYEHMLGVLVSVNTTGYAVGGPLMNLVYEMTGSYRAILLVLGFVMIAVTVLFQFVVRAADRVKNID